MVKETGSIGHRNAISRTDSADGEWMRQEGIYLVTMIIRGWQRKELVTQEEFNLIDAMMLEKYRPRIAAGLGAVCVLIGKAVNKRN